MERQRTTKDDYGNYFREAMHPVYEQALAARRSGEPLYVTRIRTFDASLSDMNAGPFASILQGLEAACEKQRRRTVSEVCTQIQEELDTLKTDREQHQPAKERSDVSAEDKQIIEQLAKLEHQRRQVMLVLDELKPQYGFE